METEEPLGHGITILTNSSIVNFRNRPTTGLRCHGSDKFLAGGFTTTDGCPNYDIILINSRVASLSTQRYFQEFLVAIRRAICSIMYRNSDKFPGREFTILVKRSQYRDCDIFLDRKRTMLVGSPG